MFKSIYLENISTNNGYVNMHEHNLKASHMYLESHRQLLTCSLCNISYCEACYPHMYFDSAREWVSPCPTLSHREAVS
jgi:hypothetical protein